MKLASMKLAYFTEISLACFNEISLACFKEISLLPCCFHEIYWERKSFRLFVGNNKISSRANTNKIEKITSLKFLCSNVNVSVKNIWKVAWARGSEAFAPTFTLWLEAEKKGFEASYFEISVLRKWTFLKPPCLIVRDTKKYDPYLN